MEDILKEMHRINVNNMIRKVMNNLVGGITLMNITTQLLTRQLKFNNNSNPTITGQVYCIYICSFKFLQN